MELLRQYAQSSGEEDDVEPMPRRVAVGTLAPEVDISDLQIAKLQDEASRFTRATKIESKQNHLTGFLQEA